jgi:hypothetical protein
VKTSQVLYKAADVLGALGWCQGRLQDEEGRVCAYGAIKVALDADPFGYAGSHAITAAFAFNRANGTTSITTYNDELGRTKEEVQAAFRRAAWQAAQLEEAAKDDW